MTAFRLQGEGFDLSAGPPRPVADSLAAGTAPTAIVLSARRGSPPPWVLIVKDSTPATVNAMPVVTGIRVLADRDEICIADVGLLYFSTEVLPVIEPYPGGSRAAYCPRCKLQIEAGMPAVRCPECGVYHHQLEERPCYTYAPACAVCGAPAELGAGYRWIPEEP